MAPSTDNVLQPFERSVPLASAEAFSGLFTRTHLIVFRYIYGLQGGPQETVEDLTAETFLRAWHGRSRFEGNEQAALRWLLRIARNLVIDSYRRGQVRPQTEDLAMTDLPSRNASPEEELLSREQAGNLLNALTRLPPRQREMITLRFILGWRVKDVASHLGLLENTVSVSLRRALERLRQDWPGG